MATLLSSNFKGFPSRSVLLPAAIAILALLAASTASAKDERPGVGRNPAFVCLNTTITDKGHTRQTRITRHSGNRQADNGTLRLIRSTKIIDDTGVEREVHILVRKHGTGFAMRVFELDEELPEICFTPPPGGKGEAMEKGDGGS